jgi:Fe-S cluster assembly protein SufD
VSGNAGTSVLGVSKASLDALLAHFGEGAISAQMRHDALARFEELPVRESIRGGRSWKRDLAKIDFSQIPTYESRNVELDLEALLPAARRAGVTVERISVARERHPAAFERAFGKAVDTRDDKFASLALAFQNHGVFIDVPAGAAIDEPIVVGYEAREAALFPYTLVSVGDGARVTIVERFAGIENAPFVGAIAELVIGANAHVTYAVDQRLPLSTRIIATRRALLGANAELQFAAAELGSDHSVVKIRAIESAPGARANITAFFFSSGEQHIDLETETVHSAENTSSDTVVRTAGIGHGQGRYLGNIKILATGHGTDASLRDNALLLSEGAHVDSVPALEIAANDVKAFHGATVGAISEEEIFYAQSRGIPREEAERMIALGFFEPAVARFPGEALREELRAALAAKLSREPAVV